MNYYWICNKHNTTGATCGAGNTYLSGLPEFIPVFSEVRVARCFVLGGIFCRSFSDFFGWSIVFSVLLPFTASDYPFGIFQLFAQLWISGKY
jgi:hypothetical protein